MGTPKTLRYWDLLMQDVSESESGSEPGTPTARDIRKNAVRVFQSTIDELNKKEAPIAGEVSMNPELRPDGSMKLNATIDLSTDGEDEKEKRAEQDGVLV